MTQSARSALNAGARPVVLYIAGPGRSGSTLVERILGADPGFTNVGELVKVFEYGVLGGERCGCGARFGDCVFWQSVGRRAYGGWPEEIGRSVVTTRMLWKQHKSVALAILAGAPLPKSLKGVTRDYLATFRRLYEAIAAESGNAVIVDASKEPIHGILLAGEGVADFRILHLTRKPQGVAYSWAKRAVARPHATDERKTMASYGPLHATLLWNRAQLGSIRLRRTCDRSAVLSYEQFVANPRAGVLASLDQLDLAHSGFTWLATPAVTVGASHAIGGNPGRFRSGPIVVSEDREWQGGMSWRDRSIVATLSAPMQAFLWSEDRSRRSLRVLRGAGARP